jgi:NAD(P)-dependent dehydrogenase (short-subunit alcohol dehydrogenase family)
MKKKNRWTSEKIGDQTGRVAIVTGSNSGIGFEEALALARKGAEVVLAVRDEARGKHAAQRIRDEHPDATVNVMVLDLASLASVRAFAEAFKQKYQRLDLLVNNAGVMMPPYSKTEDGYELQFGTNHIGHFALTGLLLDRLLQTRGSRVVNVSSGAHRWGKIDFEDLHWEKKKYKKAASYGQSKIANLLFTCELQRRLEEAGAETIAVAAHPGWTATNLQRTVGLFRALNPVFAMKPWQGALPTLYAATSEDVKGGEYYGPHGFYEMRGYPTRVGSNSESRDENVAARLWQVSEELSGVSYDGVISGPSDGSTN